MAYGARGGVYITGGVADTLAEELLHGEFRQRFDAKAQYSDYVRAIPTALITRAHPALLGAAVMALSLR
jgi:glucokinase